MGWVTLSVQAGFVRYLLAYTFRDIPRLLETPVGRRHLLRSFISRLRPVLIPIAASYRRGVLRRTRVAAVVGSFGKTTTARALKATLLRRGHSHFGFNTESAVALQILRLGPRVQRAVFEAGVDRPGRMARFAWMIKPDIVVVTCIGGEHKRSFGNLEATREEKAEMVRALPTSGLAVLNGDDPNVLWMKDQTRGRVVTFGFGMGNDVQARSMELVWPPATRLNIVGLKQEGVLTLRLVGLPMAYAVLGAAATAMAEGFSLKEIAPALERLPPTLGRLEPIALHNGAWILCDTFKARIETVRAALDVVAGLPASRRIVVLGLVDELDEPVRQLYRALGEQVARTGDQAVFVGGKKQMQPFRSQAVRSGMPADKIMRSKKAIPDAFDAVRAAIKPGDLILIKGRGSQRLERIALALEGRNVRCEIKECNVSVAIRCHHCKMLERGFNRKGVV